MKLWLLLGVLPVLALVCYAPRVQAFCGFYVAKADAKLYNQASQVVLARDGHRTVLTMANDYQGTLKEFAIVIPVPTVLKEGQIHVGDRALIERIDAYTAPRLVEYFDHDPCQMRRLAMDESVALKSMGRSDALEREERARSLGVTIEAEYTVGEYDILILSAKQSGGLVIWLQENQYRVPAGATQILNSYIRQGLKFFVAKVNLEAQSKLGYTYLRPIQIAFESPRFGLPIRLGTLNAKGTQELFIYTLTKSGRVETANYRTVKLPSNMDLPLHVKDEFGDFYRAMFDQSVKRENMRTVFTEYAWAMNLCDPCSADPLTRDELRGLGVFWLDEASGRGGVPPVFVTRLHLRYDKKNFPEDLVLHETSDQSSFQGRYVLRHPFESERDCKEYREYRAALRERQERQAETLATLTGWDVAMIRSRIEFASLPGPPKSWWDRLWSN